MFVCGIKDSVKIHFDILIACFAHTHTFDILGGCSLFIYFFVCVHVLIKMKLAAYIEL